MQDALEILGVFTGSAILTGVFQKYASRLHLVDIPNSRSSHNSLIPRGGGIVFISVWLLYIISHNVSSNTIGLIIGSLLVAFIGLSDDISPQSPSKRITVHSIAAIGVAAFWMFLEPDNISINSLIIMASIAFALVCSTNSFNFMDGINGLAGSQACFILITFGIIHDFDNDYMISISLSAAVLGFLVWNFPFGKIFMGDVGSGFLGFFILGSALHFGRHDLLMSILEFVIINAIFIADTTSTLLRRILSRDTWWKAHREHAYQRLIHVRKWNHPQVVGFVFAFNILLGGTLLALHSSKIGCAVAVTIASTISIAYLAIAEYFAPSLNRNRKNHDNSQAIFAKEELNLNSK